ncbi:MAG: hypothetical protein QME73_02185 [Bacillota bacterium]|nr:hypothetical protein [Bacillota bacterium]
MYLHLRNSGGLCKKQVYPIDDEVKQTDMLPYTGNNERLFKQMATLFFYGLLGRPEDGPRRRTD